MKEYEVIHEQRRCDAKDYSGPGGRCPNIVTHWAQPKGYNGPVYCVKHADLALGKLAWRKP
jgi:hypothetical protein